MDLENDIYEIIENANRIDQKHRRTAYLLGMRRILEYWKEHEHSEIKRMKIYQEDYGDKNEDEVDIKRENKETLIKLIDKINSET